MNSAAMKQPRYWMWTRRKLPPPPLFNSPITTVAAAASAYNESWEEQAFAEDSAGLLGGCIWPPRSYSCSFCGREFRSAQALGGHMNVHRRDRARLKQSSSPGDEGSEQYPDQDSNLEYYTSSPNPNPNSRVSPVPVVLPGSMELKLELGAWKVIREVGSKGKRDREKDDELMTSNKRCRSTVNPSASGLQLAGRSEVLKLSPTPIEELDLELRLGDPPKVK